MPCRQRRGRPRCRDGGNRGCDHQAAERPLPWAGGDISLVPRRGEVDLQRRRTNRVAAGAPVRKLLFIEQLGHTRVPFAGYRPHHRAGVELAAIDAHRAAEAAADLEGGFDDRVAREARRDRFEIGDFPGGLRRAIPFLLVGSGRRVGSALYGGERPGPHVYCAKNGVFPRPPSRPR